jgi:hypothetical protein
LERVFKTSSLLLFSSSCAIELTQKALRLADPPVTQKGKSVRRRDQAITLEDA